LPVRQKGGGKQQEDLLLGPGSNDVPPDKVRGGAGLAGLSHQPDPLQGVEIPRGESSTTEEEGGYREKGIGKNLVLVREGRLIEIISIFWAQKGILVKGIEGKLLLETSRKANQ